jgi:hypothetical protein
VCLVSYCHAQWLESLEFRLTELISKGLKFRLRKRIEEGRFGSEHDLQDRRVRRQQFGHLRQIKERPMRERVRIVDC